MLTGMMVAIRLGGWGNTRRALKDFCWAGAESVSTKFAVQGELPGQVLNQKDLFWGTALILVQDVLGRC